MRRAPLLRHLIVPLALLGAPTAAAGTVDYDVTGLDDLGVFGMVLVDAFDDGERVPVVTARAAGVLGLYRLAVDAPPTLLQSLPELDFTLARWRTAAGPEALLLSVTEPHFNLDPLSPSTPDGVLYTLTGLAGSAATITQVTPTLGEPPPGAVMVSLGSGGVLLSTPDGAAVATSPTDPTGVLAVRLDTWAYGGATATHGVLPDIVALVPFGETAALGVTSGDDLLYLPENADLPFIPYLSPSAGSLPQPLAVAGRGGPFVTTISGALIELRPEGPIVRQTTPFVRDVAAGGRALAFQVADQLWMTADAERLDAAVIAPFRIDDNDVFEVIGDPDDDGCPALVSTARVAGRVIAWEAGCDDAPAPTAPGGLGPPAAAAAPTAGAAEGAPPIRGADPVEDTAAEVNPVAPDAALRFGWACAGARRAPTAGAVAAALALALGRRRRR